ncbi:hypothetical protein NUU61_005818 [Penicillium alfredii]|uniref:Uncharacterized protein n=1 Tax=Penicillium alfredii TaxID=1506179 RepID=A0A9W9FA50_9EURO|nr:uncharacterized protein NUU61_005818 [Penicillium alfredii]KAJ5096462.1 hypothetical protein NUU61_005818 [Penicillium alfredii]
MPIGEEFEISRAFGSLVPRFSNPEMLSLPSQLSSACLLILADLVRAKPQLPSWSPGPQAKLKAQDGVTFDPLGVAAVLYNPRVDHSAARLYTQYDHGLFTWPHMIMIGGTLPPMQMLVERLTATMRWIHPSIKLCAKDTTMLPVQSDVSENVFQQLPLNLSNVWFSDIVSFETSSHPGNDFAVVVVDTIFQPLSEAKRHVRDRLGIVRWRILKWALDLSGLVNGAMLFAGTVFGILVADIWAFTLFFLYSSHWLASLLISRTSMVKIHKPARVKPDSTLRYAVWQRAEGGTVIFKGRQNKLEEWARSTWEYDRTWVKDCLHWLWIMSGTLSGIASVACMVNMRGYMQLAFLGTLIYGSLAEIGATRIARILQTAAHGEVPKATVQDNKYRTEGIIRATLEVDESCRLTNLDWIELGLLPSYPVFHKMQELLRDLSTTQTNEDKTKSSGDIRDGTIHEKCAQFLELFDFPHHHEGLAKRIVKEIQRALGIKMPAEATEG